MFNTFQAVDAYLKQFVPGSILNGDVYIPDRMYKLLPLLGSPETKVKVVHVAGTSGKTSTSYYSAALLRAAGAKVGLSVSPHLFCVNERVQVNGEPLPEQQFCQLFSRFVGIPGVIELRPTYFELLIAFAFWTFAERGCDYAIMEVGLGGLKDATNVVHDKNKVCIMTDIGLDHTRILGKTITSIARNKAGIIQPHNHVFCMRQLPEAREVIHETCADKQAKLHEYDKVGETIAYIPDLPLFQRRNWFLAAQACAYIIERDGLTPLSSAKLTFTQAKAIPARQQVVRLEGKTVILDGAHNPQKLTALAESLGAQYAGKPMAILAAFSVSKEAGLQESIGILRGLSDCIVLTQFTLQEDLPHKGIQPELLGEMCKTAGFKTVIVEPSADEALKVLLEQDAEVFLITGSFYLIGSLKQALTL